MEKRCLKNKSRVFLLISTQCFDMTSGIFQIIGKLNFPLHTMYATKCSMIPSLTYKNIPLSILMMKYNLKDWLLIAHEGSRSELFCTEAQVSFTYETTFSSVRNCCYWFPVFLWVNCVHFWKNKLCYIEDVILGFSFSSVLENFLAIKVNRHREIRENSGGNLTGIAMYIV